MKKDRSKLERRLDEINHTMELIRTVVPVVVLLVQIVILTKIWKSGTQNYTIAATIS